MSLLLTSVTVEINTDDTPSSKDLHFLRKRLQEAFNELVPSILEEAGILTENPHSCHLDEIEIQDESPTFHD